MYNDPHKKVQDDNIKYPKKYICMTDDCIMKDDNATFIRPDTSEYYLAEFLPIGYKMTMDPTLENNIPGSRDEIEKYRDEIDKKVHLTDHNKKMFATFKDDEDYNTNNNNPNIKCALNCVLAKNCAGVIVTKDKKNCNMYNDQYTKVQDGDIKYSKEYMCTDDDCSLEEKFQNAIFLRPDGSSHNLSLFMPEDYKINIDPTLDTKIPQFIKDEKKYGVKIKNMSAKELVDDLDKKVHLTKHNKIFFEATKYTPNAESPHLTCTLHCTLAKKCIGVIKSKDKLRCHMTNNPKIKVNNGDIIYRKEHMCINNDCPLKEKQQNATYIGPNDIQYTFDQYLPENYKVE